MVTLKLTRRGFTLIELLVVIAIIAVLVALLLPAVQRARESARRTQCNNNLKQLGLALHNYHDVHSCFPKSTGWTNGAVPNPVAGTDHNGFSWRVMILPMLEQSAIYDGLNMNLPLTNQTGSPSNYSLIKQPVKAFLCPSDPTGEMSKSGAQYLWSNWCFPHSSCPMDSLGVTNYKGYVGSAFDLSLTTSKYPIAMFDRRRGPAVKMNHLLDGTSHVIAVGEVSPEYYGWPSWASWHSPISSAYGPNHARRLYGGVGSRTAVQHGWTDGFSASSFHGGGVNILMGDGSVHFISDSIHVQTYQQLVHPADAQPNGFSF